MKLWNRKKRSPVSLDLNPGDVVTIYGAATFNHEDFTLSVPAGKYIAVEMPIEPGGRYKIAFGNEES